jgi:hypothetical protein
VIYPFICKALGKQSGTSFPIFLIPAKISDNGKKESQGNIIL